MIQFLLVFVFMLVFVAAMAIGVLAGRKPIAGSCGGLAGMGVDCEVCRGDPNRCDAVGTGVEVARGRTRNF
jgi:hypothetical protein